MGRLRATQTVSAIVAATIALQPIVSCGNASRSPAADRGSSGTNDGLGEGGGAADNGTGTHGGSVVQGGRSGAGGSSSNAANSGYTSGGVLPSQGASGATSGPLGCIDGAPCTCERLVGTVECDGDEGPVCECPPAEQCPKLEGTSCFVPCGGEPFGSWVLVDSCFPTAAVDDGADCWKTLEGTPGENDLRIRLLDGGWMEFIGVERWSLRATATLPCFLKNSVNTCADASYWDSPFLFSSGGPLSCEPNACGYCECTAEMEARSTQNTSWERKGAMLRLGSANVPYCVNGDELWIGGGTPGTPTRPAYRFEKRSCAGQPIACEARSAEQCERGTGCVLGRCSATTGTSARCTAMKTETECGTAQGCTWDPDACVGKAAAACEFRNCEDEPGCTWGEPTAKCGGYSDDQCERELSDCVEECAVRVCAPGDGTESGDCTLLTSAADCEEAPGCTASAAGAEHPCTGTPECITQTDATICQKLGCTPQKYCSGAELPCHLHTAENCHRTPGCRLEW